jgi:hypothetical protein
LLFRTLEYSFFFLEQCVHSRSFVQMDFG